MVPRAACCSNNHAKGSDGAAVFRPIPYKPTAVVEARESQAAKARQREHGGTAPGRKKQSGKIATSEPGRTRDRIARGLGVSGRTLDKETAVVVAAERGLALHVETT